MTHEEQGVNEEAMRRQEESEDPRVPSDPEHFHPADVPDEPLTRGDVPGPTVNDDKTDVQSRPEPKEEEQTHGESTEESDAS